MGLNLVHLFAHLTWPAMPELALKMHAVIQPPAYENGAVSWPGADMAQELDDLEPGQPIQAPEVLVAKISDEQVEEWKARFGA
jgi:methionyl-tRNA synthetase